MRGKSLVLLLGLVDIINEEISFFEANIVEKANICRRQMFAFPFERTTKSSIAARFDKLRDDYISFLFCMVARALIPLVISPPILFVKN